MQNRKTTSSLLILLKQMEKGHFIKKGASPSQGADLWVLQEHRLFEVERTGRLLDSITHTHTHTHTHFCPMLASQMIEP